MADFKVLTLCGREVKVGDTVTQEMINAILILLYRVETEEKNHELTLHFLKKITGS